MPRNAKTCPECGSDETTGWSKKAHADNLGLPEEEFDYDEFVAEEFGSGRSKPRGIGWFWWVIALLLALVLVLIFSAEFSRLRLLN